MLVNVTNIEAAQGMRIGLFFAFRRLGAFGIGKGSWDGSSGKAGFMAGAGQAIDQRVAVERGSSGGASWGLRHFGFGYVP